MSNREQTFKIEVMVNPDTPFSRIRTLFPTANNEKSAKSKVKKFGRILSCVKFVTDGYYHKTEFMDKPKGATVVDDSFTLSEAIAFNKRVVIEDGFTLSKSMRLERLERDNKEKEKKYLDEILDNED